ncbi:MAG TPA: TRAP transporter TatT component family protein, partial [Polyangiales bacterium]|nr:TRAP transporter TatT component family protein [Polyangiales bacterium]
GPALLALAVLVCASACNLTAITIKGTVDATREFTTEHGGEFADPEIVGPFLAGGLVTAEGTLYYVPDYEPLLQGTIYNNVAYGVGWLQAQSQEAELAGKYDEAEHLNKRAGLLFARALTLTKRMLRLRDEGFDKAMASGVDKFKIWVDDNFYEKDDAEPLLVAGLAMLVSMLESEEGLAAAVDRPYAQYMVERSVELDPTIQGGTGLATLGQVWCTVPAMVGGNPKFGLELMQRAMAITNRGSHGVLVSAAERCAVALQDRKMFHDLLMEVIEAGDVPKYRLANKLARRRAERLLKQIDELFYD